MQLGNGRRPAIGARDPEAGLDQPPGEQAELIAVGLDDEDAGIPRWVLGARVVASLHAAGG